MTKGTRRGAGPLPEPAHKGTLIGYHRSMARGLSDRQRRLLALLHVARRPLTVAELLQLLDVEPTDSSRRSLLRALRSLRDRGLVELEHRPAEGGGWPRVEASAAPGAAGELTGRDVQRAKGKT